MFNSKLWGGVITEFDIDFPRVFGGPLSSADFRSQLEDFIVDEQLGFEPEGEGEHVYLHMLKRGMNTQWLVKNIAKFAKVKERDVGYCGMKDRHAVTTQWLSLYMPKKAPPVWAEFEADPSFDVQFLSVAKGAKKLRRGQHQCNQFKITLRNFAAPPADVEALLSNIKQNGVPNYFGEQRFGHGGNNLHKASKWLDDGFPIAKCGPKSIIMSAARSYIFNLYLAERVRLGSWSDVIAGDVVNEQGEALGPMWGRGKSKRTEDALGIEANVYVDLKAWLDGLEHCGLNQEGRALVLKPIDFSWTFEQEVLCLAFSLAPGQYATSMLREIALLNNCTEPKSE